MQIVFNIQAAKIAQENFKKRDLSQRAELIEKLATTIFESRATIIENIATEESLPADFVSTHLVEALQKKIENLRIEVQIYSQPHKLLPTGLIGARFDHQFLWCELILLAANCLASGNSAIVIVPDLNLKSVGLAKNIISQSGVPTDLITFIDDPKGENAQMLSAHPGVRAILIKGDEKSGENLARTAFSKKKKVQLYLGAKNSCLVHPDFDFENKMDEILQPFLIGSGQLSINCHRLFISQNIEKKFYEVLKETLNNKYSELKIRSQSNLSLWEQSISQVAQDSGKILYGGKSLGQLKVEPTWTQDLSNCSVMQQQSIPGPFYIVTAVKYVHEMVKWSNTGEYGHSAVVWGPEDKVTSIAQNLNVGHVHLNKWSGFFEMGTPVKGSFLGIPNCNWSGEFYSDVKKLT